MWRPWAPALKAWGASQHRGVFKRFPRPARIKQNAFVGRTSSVGPAPAPTPAVPRPNPERLHPTGLPALPWASSSFGLTSSPPARNHILFPGKPPCGASDPNTVLLLQPPGDRRTDSCPPPPLTRPGCQTCSEPRACPCSRPTPRRLPSCRTHLPAPHSAGSKQSTFRGRLLFPGPGAQALPECSTVKGS